MKDFKDKVAVVTGATRGIGRSIAERCAAEGMKVILGGRDQKALKDFQDEIQAYGGTSLGHHTAWCAVVAIAQ